MKGGGWIKSCHSEEEENLNKQMMDFDILQKLFIDITGASGISKSKN